MGRRARPVELQLKKGNHLTKREIAARKQAEQRLSPPADQVKPPDWLDVAALREWQKVTAALDGLGILTNADVNTLAVYCDAAARYAEAARMVQEQGAVIDAGRGPQQNPAVLVAEKYWRIMNKAAAALGLDPTSRAALAKYQAEAGRQDEFDRLFGTG